MVTGVKYQVKLAINAGSNDKTVHMQRHGKKHIKCDQSETSANNAQAASQ